MTTKVITCPNYTTPQTWVDLFDEMCMVKLFISEHGWPSDMTAHQRGTVTFLLLKIHKALTVGPVLRLRQHKALTELEELALSKLDLITKVPHWHQLQPMFKKAGSTWVHGLNKPTWVLSVGAQDSIDCEVDLYDAVCGCSRIHVISAGGFTLESTSLDTSVTGTPLVLRRGQDPSDYNNIYTGEGRCVEISIEFLQDTTCIIALTPPIHQWLNEVKTPRGV